MSANKIHSRQKSMFMEKNYLLPYKFKRAGMIMFLPFFALCVIMLPDNSSDLWKHLCSYVPFDIDKMEIPVFAIGNVFGDGSSRHYFTMATTNPFDEIVMIGMLASLCFIALSKEKDEDEMTGYIRMQSFVWSFWMTAALLTFGILFFYGLSFASFSFAAIFFCFLIYILKFNITMKKVRRENR